MSSQEQNVLNQHLIDSLRYLDKHVSVEDYILGQNKAAIIDLIRNEADLSQNEGVSDLLSKINWDGWHSAMTAESKKVKENFYENRNKANRYERY